MRPVRLVLVATFFAWAGLDVTAGAGVVVHTRRDVGVGPGQPAPDTALAAAEFAAAAGTTQLIDFEGLSLGAFASLDLGGQGTAALSGTDTTPGPGFSYGIADDHASTLFGYNTTPGGSQFLRFAPELGIDVAALTLDFARPMTAVGFTLTGLGTASGPLFVVFGPGAADERSIAGDLAGGSIFFGLTGLEPGTTRVRLELRGIATTSRDVFGLDDLRFGDAPPVVAATPEPSTLLLIALGVPALIALARSRRRAD